MFAIEITTETLPKIFEDMFLRPIDEAFIETCANKDRYFVRGYVSERGALFPWRLFIGHEFHRTFEYDENKIRTDWDQIVRK